MTDTPTPTLPRRSFIHKQAPTSILVLSVIGIVWGLFGFLGFGCTCFTTFHPIGPPNPGTEIMQDTLVRVVTLISICIGTVALSLQVVSAAASLGLHPLGRIGMIIASAITLLYSLGNLLFNAIYTAPLIGEAAVKQGLSWGTYYGLTVAGAFFAFLVVLLYNGLVLFFFNTRRSRNAFKGIHEKRELTELPPEIRDAPVL